MEKHSQSSLIYYDFYVEKNVEEIPHLINTIKSMPIHIVMTLYTCKQKGIIMIKGTMNNLMDQVFEIKLPVKYFNGDWITTGGVGSIIRQIHNQLKMTGRMSFDKLWVKTETYSGGNSVNIYLLNPTEETNDLSKRIMDQFQYGSFNGMIDLYEYSPKDTRPLLTLEDGRKIEVTSKYNFTNSKPPWGCKEYYELYPQYKESV